MLTSCFLSGGGSPSSGGWIEVPQFTYTGQSETIVEEGIGWKIRFLTSGTFTLLSPDRMMIDAFLVGGGGGGAKSSTTTGEGPGGGGGGGLTGTYFVQVEKDVPYEIAIGAGGETGINGGVTHAFDFYIEGGFGSHNYIGGDGGNNGGNGSANSGYSGKDGASDGNPGQGTTTREFGEPDGEDYAGGGGGGGYHAHNGSGNQKGGAGGASGGIGGDASNRYSVGRPGSNIDGKGGKGGGAVSNYAGGGGGGGNYGGGGGGAGLAYPGGFGKTASGGAGGQGIVIIRNHRAKQATLSD